MLWCKFASLTPSSKLHQASSGLVLIPRFLCERLSSPQPLCNISTLHCAGLRLFAFELVQRFGVFTQALFTGPHSHLCETCLDEVEGLASRICVGFCHSVWGQFRTEADRELRRQLLAHKQGMCVCVYTACSINKTVPNSGSPRTLHIRLAVYLEVPSLASAHVNCDSNSWTRFVRSSNMIAMRLDSPGLFAIGCVLVL